MHPKKILPQVIAPLPCLLFPFFRFFSIHLFTIKVGSVSSVESTFTPTSPLHGKPWSPFEKMEHWGDEMGKVCKSFLVNQPPLTYPARNKGFKKKKNGYIMTPAHKAFFLGGGGVSLGGVVDQSWAKGMGGLTFKTLGQATLCDTHCLS